ncbi:MAG: hypothetical protein JSR33_08875 [Proteobacteria bacterium]|nr:hypothetical protein [Pseudomonadota bacterium]
MANDSLTNLVVFKNCRFRRVGFPFDNSMLLRIPDAVVCCLFVLKKQMGSKRSAYRLIVVKGDGLLWAILVHEPVRPTNRSLGRSALVGGDLVTQP